MEKTFTFGENDALIIIDPQNDFCSPKGALPVPDAEQAIPVINDYIKLVEKTKAKFFATRDWHPPNHISFKQRGGPWPPHCIQETEGAKFHPNLKLTSTVSIISKATDPDKESYSAFDDTPLEQQLKAQNIQRLFIGGFATDYCVKYTILKAMSLGFGTVLLLDSIRGINHDDTENALNEMTQKGVTKVALADFPDDVELPTDTEYETDGDEKPTTKAIVKKKARLRARGPYRKIKTER